MWIWVLALIFPHIPFACFHPSAILDTVNCSQGLGCRILEVDGLCGETVPDPDRGAILTLTHMEMSNTLRCQKQKDCIPCVQVTLRLGLLEPPALDAKQNGGAEKSSMSSKRHHGNTGVLQTHVLLSSWTYPSSRCVTVEIRLPHGHDWNNSSLGFLHFDCFPVAIRGELYVTAFTNPPYPSPGLLQLTHYGPDCTWHKAQDAIRLCQVPKLEASVGPEEAVLHVSDVPEGLHFHLLLYLNQTSKFESMGEGTTMLTGPENVSIPISWVLPCLCLQVWPEVEDQEDPPRTHLCPFASNAEALSRAWAQSHLDLEAFEGNLSCSISAPCDLSGVIVPCWRGERSACHPLHPQLHMTLILHVPQEFPGLRPHPNLCVQVISNGTIYLQRCLQEENAGPHLLLRKTPGSQGNASAHILEEGKWVLISQAAITRNGFLEEALEHDLQSGECMLLWEAVDNETGMLWACSLEKYHRTRWAPAWMITLFGLCFILLVLLLKKEALKDWLRILKEDYTSGGVFQGQHVLLLYSPDHRGFERLVGTLAGALSQLQLSVSLELWSRGEMRSLGPMQWLHAQKRRVLQEGGIVVLLFSPGALAGCAQWLGWGQKATLLSPDKPDSTFLASLNCVLPDFLVGKARDKYIVACFEELLPVDKIPPLFHSVPVYALPSQLFSFLQTLAGLKGRAHPQRGNLKRHAVWISKSLERAVRECQQKQASWQHEVPLLTPQPADEETKGADYPFAAS
uniref:Interleukin-17 receptor C isoform X2 n=1 Tax=Pogona vitticeps TaxID=103695 RepID=A0ABM5FIZ6_9SAUR